MTANNDNLPLCMIRRNLANLPEVVLPPDYVIRPIQLDEGATWVEIVRDSERFFTVPDDLWDKQFGFDPAEAVKRVYLVMDPHDTPVATIGAWYASEKWAAEKGAGWGRIHWVATRPTAQGKGIGRAMTAFALRRLAELGHEQAYLETSTGRRAALRLYDAFGFEPHPLTDPEALRQFQSQVKD